MNYKKKHSARLCDCNVVGLALGLVLPGLCDPLRELEEMRTVARLEQVIPYDDAVQVLQRNLRLRFRTDLLPRELHRILASDRLALR
eukprot:292391-Lingulodinium_polyedra.AAC.1